MIKFSSSFILASEQVAEMNSFHALSYLFKKMIDTLEPHNNLEGTRQGNNTIRNYTSYYIFPGKMIYVKTWLKQTMKIVQYCKGRQKHDLNTTS